MLPPFIIDQIRRREEDQRRRREEQPRVDLPLPSSRPMPAPTGGQDRDEDRGAVIIDLGA